MLLKNWHEYMRGAISKDTAFEVVNCSGVNFITAYNYSFNSTSTVNAFFHNFYNCVTNYTAGVVFGNGNTQPTESDYRLSGTLHNNISASSNVVYKTEGNKLSMEGVFTITNNGTEDMIVSECGYVGSVKQSSSLGDYMLLDRTLLEEPITIPAGGVGQVTYTITFNFA